MYAIIATGGKQYKVAEGEVIRVEKLDVEPGTEYVFDQVLAIGGEELVYAARAISTRTYEQMFPLVGTAVIYLILVMIFTWLQGILERRLRQSDRR